MPTLLVQSCSKSKNETFEPIPALELYSGYFFKIIKKSLREGAFDDSMDIYILSAEHGLIDANTEIESYDRRMDTSRAAELSTSVQSHLRDAVADAYDEVIINVGSEYQRALDDVSNYVEADVYYIKGEGIGHKGHVLKRVIRGEREPLSKASTQALNQ